MTTTRMSARELAAAFSNAKSAATRSELRAYCAERAKQSDKARWAHLLAAIEAGDKARIAYHASVGEAKREAAKALAPKPAKAAPAKPAAKPVAAKPAKPAKTPAPKQPDAIVALADTLGIHVDDVRKLAAFLRPDLLRA